MTSAQSFLKAQSLRGKTAFHAGQAAEAAVARLYQQRGGQILETRWRSSLGEIDLIVQIGHQLVCVEVKKSRTFDQAAQSLRPSQMERIYGCAEVYLGQTKEGQMSEIRFDVALVDGHGQVKILENAFGLF